MRLVSNSELYESSRNVVLVSESEVKGSPELGFGLTLTVPELDSIETVWSQVMLHELQKDKSFE